MPPLRNNTFVNTVTENEKPDPVKIFLICLLFITVLLSVIFYGLSFYFSYKSKAALDEIATISARLNALPLDKMTVFSKKLTTLGDIQRTESNPTSILTIVSDSIEKNSYITNASYFNRGKETVLKLVGVADSYEDVIRHVDKLKSSKYSTVISKTELVSISVKEIKKVSKVLFSLDITMDPSIRVLPFEPEYKDFVPLKESEVKKISTSTPLKNSSTLDPKKVLSTTTTTTTSSLSNPSSTQPLINTTP
jgi:hypothetical protein